MIYWRLILLAAFVLGVSLMTMPLQISQIEYSLSHNRTRMLEEDLQVTSKAVASAKKSGDQKKYVEALESLGWVYFELSDVTKAEPIFLEELKLAEEKKSSSYDATYAHALLNIATYYRERADYPRAAVYYNKIRDYDTGNLKRPDSRRARDLANLGLLYYLWGETVNEADKRADLFCRAESFCETALSEYQSLPDSRRAQGNVFATQALVLRDLGLSNKADVADKLSRQILTEAGNKAVEP
jgi:tetratricopeptide (TPR) repeat protein